MTGKTLRIATAAIAVALAIVVGWSIVARNFIVPIIAIILPSGLAIYSGGAPRKSREMSALAYCMKGRQGQQLDSAYR